MIHLYLLYPTLVEVCDQYDVLTFFIHCTIPLMWTTMFSIIRFNGHLHVASFLSTKGCPKTYNSPKNALWPYFNLLQFPPFVQNVPVL